MKGFRKLIVWHKAHEMTLKVYRATKSFPANELYGLVNQMRRASVSVVANIVEGHARASKREFLQFLFISYWSLVELEYYLELANRIHR